eukprot:5640525-Ditylum_brightwellii.AAC.1
MNGGHGINQFTAYHWMCNLGYKFCKQHKYYYTDAHEQEDVVWYRVKFSHCHLCSYEPYMMHWVQIPLKAFWKIYGHKKVMVDMSNFRCDNEKHEEMKTVDVLLQRGSTYSNDSNIEMVEFHVDALADEMLNNLNCFVEDAYKRQSGHGVNPSIFRRDKDRKILLSLGQDECIFKQYLLHQKTGSQKMGASDFVQKMMLV